MKNHLSFSIIREMKYILISLALILICGFFASEILALRCITTDGLQVEEVRRVIKKCMKKITSSDDGEDVRGYEEYENFESEDFEMKDVNNGRGGGNGGSSNNNDRMNANNNYNPRFNQYDERSTQTGGNYYEMNRPRNNRHDPWVQQQFNPYQQPSPYMHDRGNNNYFGSNQQRGDSRNNNNNNNNNHTHQNKNINNDNSTDKHERDRACIFQCFFQELKMVMYSRLLFPFQFFFSRYC